MGPWLLALALTLAQAQAAPAVRPPDELAAAADEQQDPCLSALVGLSDEDLTRQKSAFEQLRQLHRHLLRRCQVRAQPDHVREKLFSDYLTRLWIAWDRHRSGAPEARVRSFYGLSRRIVHSTVVDDLRSHTRGSLAPDVAPLASEPAVPEPDDFDVARRLAALDAPWREALEATLRTGSVRAAAGELGLSPAQVRYRVDRAREGLLS